MFILYVRVPAGGAELMNLKLQQVASQTRRISKKKDYSEDNDEIPAFGNFQIPVQDNTEIRTASSALDSTKDNTQIYNKVCASPVVDVNAESDSQKNEVVPVQFTENTTALVSKTDLSQPECTSSDRQGFKLSEQPFMSVAPLSLSAESGICDGTASESDNCVVVPIKIQKDAESDGVLTEKGQDGVSVPIKIQKDVESDSVLTEKGQDGVSVPIEIQKDVESDGVLTENDQDGVSAVIDMKQICTGVSEEMCSEAPEVMVMGMGSSSKEAVPPHIVEYRSPLEHFHSERQGIVHKVGTSQVIACVSRAELSRIIISFKLFFGSARNILNYRCIHIHAWLSCSPDD
jgi:hypothetical protein